MRLLVPEKWQSLIRSYEPRLPTLFIVSQAVLVTRPEDPEGFSSEVIPGLRLWVARAEGKKCERCWNYRTEIGTYPDHPTICRRCFQAIGGTA